MFQKKFILEEWKKEHAEALNAIAAHDAEVYYKEVGHEEGRAEGRQQTILETITSMLKKKCSFDFISEITGKSISEIKEIEKTMM